MIRYIRPVPLDPARALDQHERSLEEWELYGFGKRAMIEAETDRWLGFVELSHVGPGKGSRDEDVEIGYFVEPSCWGQGFATEAAFATRDEAFDRCGIDELIGRCRVENVASARVLAKVGFTRLRLFELGDGIIVEIHRLQRANWDGPATPREHRMGESGPCAAERSTVKPGNTLVAEGTGEDRVAYDVVLLAGSPRRETLFLAADLAEGDEFDANGDRWTIADVRHPDGAVQQLICIYAV